MSQDKLIKDINTKYQDLGENPDPYLSGLRYTNPTNYWDYCEVDTLLTPKSQKLFYKMKMYSSCIIKSMSCSLK